MSYKSLIKFGFGSYILLVSTFSHAGDASDSGKHSWKDKIFNGKNYFQLAAGVDDSFKIRGNSGINSDGESTFVVDAGFGREVFSRTRLGLDYQYRHFQKLYETSTATTTSWGWRAHTALARVSYDLLPSDQRFVPYVLGGAGVSFLNSSDHLVESTVASSSIAYKGKTQAQFAWKAGAGVRMKSWRHCDTLVEYSYIDRGMFETNNQRIATSGTTTTAPMKGNAKSHNVVAGISINF